MTKAVTEDAVIYVRLASFYPIDKMALVMELTKAAEKHAKENNFLVYRVSLEGKNETDQQTQSSRHLC